jgi:3-hydroxyisobutyrate dehydrogenase
VDDRPVSAVAVLGTGIMGAAIARRLAGAGLEVRVWNRTRERAEALAEDVAAVAGTAAEASDGADAILTVLADADAVEAAMTGADGGLAGAAGDASWVQASTVGLAGIERLAALADEHGLVFVDAPVLGTKQPAEQGKLIVLASGPDEAAAPLEPVFAAIGERALWLGDAGAGSRMKLVVNAWLLSLTAALAEAIAAAERLGVDPDAFLDVIKGGAVGPPYAELKGRAMTSREFGEVAFPLQHAEKDSRLVLEALDGAGLELVEATHAAFRRAVEAGHGDEDMAAVYLAHAEGRR